MPQDESLEPICIPRPFSHFPLAALRAEKAMRRLVAIADLFGSPHCSLRCVAKRVEALPDGFSLSTIRSLARDRALVGLLSRSFERPVEIYLRQKSGRRSVIGLSEDGKLVVQMAREFLAELDSQTS